MAAPALLLLLVMAAIPIIGGVIVLVLVVSLARGSQRRPEPGLGPDEWSVQFPPGGVGGLFFADEMASYGTFRLQAGTLVYTPAQASGTPWSLPCAQIVVRKLDLFTVGGADLELRWPEGTMRCTVSRERINRTVHNDLKGMRERGYADDFIAALLAQGATVG